MEEKIKIWKDISDIQVTDFQKILEYYDNKNEHEKHLKGYIFDSLVYRYQLARFSQADYEARVNGESIQDRRDLAVRDIMRFIQILDEAIGEHD